MELTIEEDGSVKYEVWWKNGSMLVNRQYLSPDHPESLYQLFVRNGLSPEKYGIMSFDEKMAYEFKDCSREELIAEILSLRKTVTAYERWA